MDTGWGTKMQGQTKKYYPTIGGVEIFWGWRSEPLSALATIPVTLLLCFGVFVISMIFPVITSLLYLFCGSRKQVIQPWASVRRAAAKGWFVRQIAAGVRSSRCELSPRWQTLSPLGWWMATACSKRLAGLLFFLLTKGMTATQSGAIRRRAN